MASDSRTADQFFTHLKVCKTQPELDDFWRMQRDVRVAARNANHPFYGRDKYHANAVKDLLPQIFAADMSAGTRYTF